MAAVTVTPTVKSIENGLSSITVRGTVAISASSDTLSANGDTFDLTKGFAPGQSLPAASVPKSVKIQSAKTGGVSGYLYAYTPGTTAASGKIEVFQSAGSAAPLAQVTGATPAAVSGDTIAYEAVFAKCA